MVIIACRQRRPGVGVGDFDGARRREIHEKPRNAPAWSRPRASKPRGSACRCFRPGSGIFSGYDEVRTDTGEPVNFDRLPDEAADAVIAWPVQQIASRRLDGVDAEGRFSVVLGRFRPAEFRYNRQNF
jgi:hypothetical protein